MIDMKDPKRDELVKEVLKKIDNNQIKYCQLHFTSIEGTIKSFGIRANKLPDAFEIGEGFDGSSINGYGRIEESDMVAVPDPSTFAILPWQEANTTAARLLCDIYTPNGDRYEGDPRYILQRAMKKAADMGYIYYAAPELEFFLLKKDGENVPRRTDVRGYFDLDHTESDHQIRRQIAIYADFFPNIQVEKVHHEVARSQHEVDIRYDQVGEIADATITMKMIIKSVATQYGNIATFMPKPWNGHNGSGMHVHQSIWRDGENLFYDAQDPNKISDLLRFWIGGQLHHAKEMTGILDSWPNSYKRLVPGYEAPTYIAWGFKNRSMLIRVPNFFQNSKAARCEIRSPDPAGNVYLQLAVLLSAGLDGIVRKISPGAPNELNVYGLSSEEKARLGIENLPESMGQALHTLRHSAFMKDVLGNVAYEAFINSKTQENQIYNMEVSEWELSRYAEVL